MNMKTYFGAYCIYILVPHLDIVMLLIYDSSKFDKHIFIFEAFSLDSLSAV
jgi:hypothetical protein